MFESVLDWISSFKSLNVSSTTLAFDRALWQKVLIKSSPTIIDYLTLDTHETWILSTQKSEVEFERRV